MQPNLKYISDFLPPVVSSRLLQSLTKEVHWEQHRVRIFGRWVDTPRRSAWFGDKGASYGYSGQVYQPRPWLPQLQDLRSRVEEAAGHPFNSVLLNLYRDGTDSMGWHADDEKELGPDPVIGSVSLGASRKLRFRLKSDHRTTHEIWLEDGSLLVMGSDAQRLWQHALPKAKRVNQARVNLTFRQVLPSR